MKKSIRSFAVFLPALLLTLLSVTSCSKSGGNDDGPKINQITPGSGTTGATVVITGENLDGSSVTVGGISVEVTANTSTSLSIQIPSGATSGAKKVVVSNANGSAETSFNVTGAGAPPVITAITPASVSIGQSITITGTGLAGAVVQIATKVSAITANTATSITVTVPSGIALGSASVRVTTMLGTVVSAVNIQ